ncbi:short-chain dehydrogenase [Variovorax sp. PAMC 28711]|nr:short-chain dehydrogenase [Variovorax sp. PAMC 28711]
MPLTSFPEGFRAIVIGASGAIGGALLAHLAQHARCSRVIAIGRHTTPSLDLCDEGSIRACAASLAAQGPFHLVVHAAGVLHGAGFSPEKRLQDLDVERMTDVFRINAFGPAMVLAHFGPLLDVQRGVLALLSAKVGSIGDNRLGGWYSYRASKAALNMFVKTASIEMRRRNPRSVVLALHPGTVDSRLSAPFNGAEIGRAASDAATDLLRVMDRSGPDESGGFFSYSGERLPW